jgi:hypothetical protein
MAAPSISDLAHEAIVLVDKALEQVRAQIQNEEGDDSDVLGIQHDALIAAKDHLLIAWDEPYSAAHPFVSRHPCASVGGSFEVVARREGMVQISMRQRYAPYMHGWNSHGQDPMTLARDLGQWILERLWEIFAADDARTGAAAAEADRA